MNGHVNANDKSLEVNCLLAIMYTHKKWALVSSVNLLIVLRILFREKMICSLAYSVEELVYSLAVEPKHTIVIVLELVEK